MADFDTTKREQYGIEGLSNPTFTDIDGKYEALKEIQQARSALMEELSSNNSAAERQILHNILYDLKKAKHAVESHMVKVARSRRG